MAKRRGSDGSLPQNTTLRTATSTASQEAPAIRSVPWPEMQTVAGAPAAGPTEQLRRRSSATMRSPLVPAGATAPSMSMGHSPSRVAVRLRGDGARNMPPLKFQSAPSTPTGLLRAIR